MGWGWARVGKEGGGLCPPSTPVGGRAAKPAIILVVVSEGGHTGCGEVRVGPLLNNH